MKIWVKLIVVTIVCLPAAGRAQVLPKVAEADLSKLKPDNFSDEELDLPYYLAHFHRIANAVVETGENRGFIDIAVWRSGRDNQPYNARVMENCLSLAYFYCTNRPWNPYYADSALRQRLEAALDFWCRIQSSDGRFSEYQPNQFGLAPTAFAVKFMGETLTLLHNGPQIDSIVHKRVIEGMRKALFVTFTDPAFYEHGSRYTNQYTNAFAGALAFLSVCPDKEIERLVREKVEQTHSVFQSPVGYFYERDGPDWGYNLTTHHSNLYMAHRYSIAMPLQKYFVEEEQRFVEWLAYNAVPEPGTSVYVLNRAIETRQQRTALEKLGPFLQQEAFLSQEVPLSRAFMQSNREVQLNIAERRNRFQANWPAIDEFRPGQFRSYSPYAFLNRKHARWYPTESERAEAVAALPYIKRERFIHQRVDSRKSVQFTYIRRPGYYAVFNSGEILSAQQRYGLGLIWSPRTGAVLQSQTNSREAAWGTTTDNQQLVYEADSLPAKWYIDGKPVNSSIGCRDLADGVMTISYPLGKNGTKQIVFKEFEIAVTITHEEPFREYVPLLIGNDDKVEIENGLFRLHRPDSTVDIALTPVVLPILRETGSTVIGKRIVSLTIPATGKMTYVLRFGSGNQNSRP
jgi:hypothetical protein